MTQSVTCIAFRKDRGPTGGPGGVLHIMKRVLGSDAEGLSFRYLFQPEHLPSWIVFFGRLLGAAGFRTDNATAALYAYFFYAKIPSDIFVVHDVGTAAGLALAKKKYFLIYHQQGTPFAEQQSFRSKKSLRHEIALGYIERLAFGHAKALGFPSHGALKLIEETSAAFRGWQVRTGSQSTFVLHNTILEDTDTPSAADQAVLDSIKAEGRLLISVGALTDAKGVDRVPLLLNELNKLDGKFHWVAVGHGKLEKKIRDLLDLYGLSSKATIITAPIQHAALLKLFDRADGYVMLHRTSIFDFATLEAMRAGCPPILSDIGGNLDFLKNDNVTLVKGEDWKEAARSIAGLDLESLRERNRQCFAEYFSPRKFRENYLAAIKKILGGNGGRQSTAGQQAALAN